MRPTYQCDRASCKAFAVRSQQIPPFAWLQGALGLLALYITTLILTTQRREDELASYREQLTLELAILSELEVSQDYRAAGGDAP